MEKKKFTMIIILTLLGLLFTVWYTQPKTPLTALENRYMGKKESVLRYSSLIKQIDIDSQTSLLFYYNGNQNVNCAVAEKKISGYRIVDVGAEVSTNKEALRVGLHGSAYDKGTKWIYFGIIYDDSVEKVVWNDIEATRFSSLDLDMFYAVGYGKLEGGEYYIYDSNGNKLDHHRLVQ